jgi:hypothetical protein
MADIALGLLAAGGSLAGWCTSLSPLLASS